MNELTKLIDQMVHEKTFSMEGVEAVKALRDRAEGLEADLVRLREIAQETEEQNHQLREVQAELSAEVTTWKSREKALVEREKKMTELEKARAVADAKSETFRECVGLVFRNTTLRREMLGNQPVVDNNGYAASHSKDETVTETVE